METEKPSDLFFLFWSLGPSSLVPAWGPSLSFSGKLDSPLSKQVGEGVKVSRRYFGNRSRPCVFRALRGSDPSLETALHWGVLENVWEVSGNPERLILFRSTDTWPCAVCHEHGYLFSVEFASLKISSFFPPKL